MAESRRIPIDEARLRPHLRDGAHLVQNQADVLKTEVDRAVGEGLAVTAPRARGNDGVMVDPRDLRGLPVVGRGVGGVSPGTDPLSALLAKERRRR